ncbi:MAG: rhamnulokinase [Bacteroidales bacterium]|nr:rhamnulokinase [Bacteroidales bacterium]
MSGHSYLAFDLGASSGRGVLGTLDKGKIELKEVNRFYNGMTNILGNYHWDFLRLFDDIKRGITACAEFTQKPESIGLDTWGVDYALLDKQGSFLGIPYAYRDHRTDTAMEELFRIIPKEKVYELTGIQFMQFNTLFQLYAAKRDGLPIMDLATDLLFVPDIINYMLTGVKKSEFTFATTSQLFNPVKGTWEKELFDAIGVSASIMQEIVQPGAIIGKLTADIARETQMPQLNVIAPATHDTGAAIAAIPADDENFAYISSGTWSLMGIESKKPLISEKTLAFNFTNEGGVEKTYRVLKNIMGLWLIQECKRCWDNKKQEFSFPEIVKMAEKAEPFRSLVDPDHASFLNPPDMTIALADYCKSTGQPVPDTPERLARCVFDSLALKYRAVIDSLKIISDKKIEKIHVIGGGSQNELLCQFTANATGLPVVAGPAEGTAIGNIMVQAMGLGHVKSLAEIRRTIKNSFDFKSYQPQNFNAWDKAYDQFKKIMK